MILKTQSVFKSSSNHGWSLLEVLAAMVIIAIGVVLFVKIQGMTSRQSENNTRILKAGHRIEKYIEDLRIKIAQDTIANWPAPGTNTTVPAGSDGITLVCHYGAAHSPKDGAVVNDVDSVAITTYWGSATLDTLKISTYVSKRF